LQEKLNEQKKLNEQSSLINSNIVPLVLRPRQDNIEGFSISKIPLAKIFKLDNKAIREVKKTFGILLDNHNIPKNYTISKIDSVIIKKWLAIEYFGDNMWAYEESMKQVMQDCGKYKFIYYISKKKTTQNFTSIKKKKELISSQHKLDKQKINICDTDIEDNDSNNQENYKNTSHILNNNKVNVINTDTDDNNSDSDNQENYEEIRHILNNNTRLDDAIASSNYENLLPSYDEFFIKKKLVTKKIVKINNNFPILKEHKVYKIVAAKLGDIGNKNISEYNNNDRPSKRTRSQRKK
ncbi:40247_t:CDS:2, partial [Gigaspora margarita]